jgi:2-polyprenyl-6-methoxyphenol hydroxylase-like FAD-dependent oxidoreductase
VNVALAFTSEPPVYRLGHAIVVGGSVTGLLAARVLSERFDQVTIVERDTLQEGAAARRGVPQARHVHVLLVRGQYVLESLFPGFIAALVTRGATQIDNGTELRWHHFGCWKAPFDKALQGIAISRPTLEHELRRRVSMLPNVTFVTGATFTRYLADWEHARVTGICCRARGPEMPEDLLRADLVVDASGRGSQTPRLLHELGYRAPPESHVKVNFGYASRIYEQPQGSRNWKAMYVVDRAPRTRGGLIFPIEGNRWLVTLLGWHGDHPPADDAGFLEFARSLPAPDLHLALTNAHPLTEAVSHGFPATWRRHYEQLDRFPSGLLVMGDALCSFNPVYGQGMTVSALEAQLLQQCLERVSTRGMPGIETLSRDFRRRVADVVAQPWQLASGEDLRFPQTPGPRPATLRFMHWYTAKLHEAAGMSPVVARKFNEVVNMIAPRSGLFGWDVFREIGRAAWRRGLGRFQRTALAPESRYG